MKDSDLIVCVVNPVYHRTELKQVYCSRVAYDAGDDWAFESARKARYSSPSRRHRRLLFGILEALFASCLDTSWRKAGSKEALWWLSIWRWVGAVRSRFVAMESWALWSGRRCPRSACPSRCLSWRFAFILLLEFLLDFIMILARFYWI